MYLEVGGSPNGPQPGPFVRSFLEAHCQLHAPSSLSPRTLQPWEPNQSGSRDVTASRLSMSWGEPSQNVFFVLSVFIPSFELEYTVSYNLVGGLFFSVSFYYNLFHFHIDVYMLCWDVFFMGYCRAWSKFPCVTRWVLFTHSFLVLHSGSWSLIFSIVVCI